MIRHGSPRRRVVALVGLVLTQGAIGNGSFAADCSGATRPADSTCVQRAAATADALTLSEVETWMYQIQALDAPGAIETLARSDYDMLVIEPGQNHQDDPYPTARFVEALGSKADGSDRVLLAYVDIGQAESWRTYWRDDWTPPRRGVIGDPPFLLTIDPDGWADNYPVAYWHPSWKDIWIGDDGIVADLAKMGFDGVYLDWVEAYDDDFVREAAAREGVDPDLEMIVFIEQIRAAGRAINPSFFVVPQNAPYLLDADPQRYVKAIDALAVEDTWFHGAGDAAWDDPRAGDLRERHDGDYATEARLAQYAVYLAAGLPVFTVDYAADPRNVALVYAQARAHGLVPLVTRVSLSRTTDTPPH